MTLIRTRFIRGGHNQELQHQTQLGGLLKTLMTGPIGLQTQGFREMPMETHHALSLLCGIREVLMLTPNLTFSQYFFLAILIFNFASSDIFLPICQILSFFLVSSLKILPFLASLSFFLVSSVGFLPKSSFLNFSFVSSDIFLPKRLTLIFSLDSLENILPVEWILA